MMTRGPACWLLLALLVGCYTLKQPTDRRDVHVDIDLPLADGGAADVLDGDSSRVDVESSGIDAGADAADASPCPGSQTFCDGQCVNLGSDTRNCGACGASCVGRFPQGVGTCSGGRCALIACAVNRADCDGDPSNGCETDLRSSTENCGGCGATCQFPNASARCSSGLCLIDECLLGFADCNGGAFDGCEINLSRSPLHCGTCRNACPAMAARPICVVGGCSVTTVSCSPGTEDCDGENANGCEARFVDDPQNCGGCGITCVALRGTARCAAGRCALASCDAGYGDCDGVAANGCETDLRRSSRHCGACGRTCSLAHAVSVCAPEGCRLAACEDGFGDCDGEASNGCEADLRGAPANCGACGNRCAEGQSCVAGVCRSGCAPPRVECGGVCVSTADDPANCGACGNRCADSPNASARCDAGACRIQCSAGFGDCDGMTANGCEADLSRDDAHCGACGTRCGAGKSCVEGRCACATTQARCGDACVTLADDIDHCGACETRCGAGQSCVEGRCVAPCPVGRVTCGAVCCAAGEVCSSGRCSARCPTGQSLCADRCIDTQTDLTNCGACERRCAPTNATPACAGGTCRVGVCAAGYGDCDSAPENGCETDLRSSDAHCGSCGRRCPTGQSCRGAACVCPTGLTMCGGVCLDTSTNDAHCGACGMACAPGQRCTGGACVATTCPMGQSNCGGSCLPTGMACDVGTGACARTGSIVCGVGASTACSVTQGAPQTEVCNEVDDDCDGAVDEGFCRIGGVCFAPGAVNPASTCQHCVPTVMSGATTTWSVRARGAQCRASAGICDPQETCDGSSPACPLQAYLPSTIICRVSAGICDVQEFCTGSSPLCPSDQRRPNGTVCRASAGICDAQETCTGGSALCPNDQRRPSGTVCRASAGICDAQETCNGSSITCPSDQWAPSTTVCRASATISACDPAEYCTGVAIDCPANMVLRSPTTEVCDNVDNDCDGSADQGLTRSCYTGASGTIGIGACRAGTQTCAAGSWGSSCIGQVLPSVEVCDGVDNDCDNQIDEGVTRSCYTGPAGTTGVGVCRSGTQMCAAGSWNPVCVGQVTPATEVCDNIDNNCNGDVDEAVTRSCYSGPPGTAGVGACRAGAQTCIGGGWGSSCNGEVRPSAEVCDGVDNDCDSMVDNGVAGVGASCRAGFGACGRTGAVQCVPGGSDVVGITGDQHTCALLRDGAVRCWGYNVLGQLGDGTTTTRIQPVAPEGLERAVSVSVGESHTCAQLDGGRTYCWGHNGAGQLGDGTTTSRTVPTPVSSITGFQQIDLGDRHSCGVRGDGTVWCWGYNAPGQLGDGTETSRSAPTQVVGITDAVAVAAGEYHTCALRLGGEVMCWGFNSTGQLGDGTTLTRLTPVTVATITTATQIDVGSRTSCARLSDGTVRCWGYNGTGQLGDGTTTNRSTPVAVSGLSAVTQIAVGESHACARLADNTLRCWGYNGFGQLGDGTTTNRSTPVAASGITSARQVSAGKSSTCAVLADATARCWGRNAYGQLGDGTFTNRTTPVPVRDLARALQCSAYPGVMAAEVCNNIDDDCDGVIDDIPAPLSCVGPGNRCVAGSCVP